MSIDKKLIRNKGSVRVLPYNHDKAIKYDVRRERRLKERAGYMSQAML